MEPTKSKQKLYDMGFKARAISMVLTDGLRISQVCVELDIHRSNMNRWHFNKDQILSAAREVSERVHKLQSKHKVMYRLKRSPWETVIVDIKSRLKSDLSLTNADLAKLSMEYAIKQNLREYKASFSFIAKVRRSFFDSLFPNLYTGPSLLRTSKKAKDSVAGNGLFSNKEYYPGDIIAYYIGNRLTEVEYDAQLRLGSTKGGYAHRLSVHKSVESSFQFSNNSRMILDCYHSAIRGDCKASMANSPFGIAKFIKGIVATANSHIKQKWRSTRRSDPDIYGPVPGTIVLLVAGRPQHANESEDAFKKYTKQICIIRNKEILCDYGDEYEYK